MSEENTKVTLRDFMDQKFKAQKEFNAAQFASLRQAIDARWKAHEKTHQRERGVIAVVGVITTAIVGWWGTIFPK